MGGLDPTWLKEVLGWRNPGFVTYLAFTTLVAFTLVWFFKRRKWVRLVDKMPGPKGLPLLGSMLYFSVDNAERFRRNIEISKYGEVARIWLGQFAVCFLSSARAMEEILRSQKHLNKSINYAFLHPWLGRSLLTSTGSHWQSRRKLLTPAFHFKILEEFVDAMNRQGSKLTRKLEKKADGKPFDIFNDIVLCVVDILCETAMGHSLKAQESSGLDYVDAVKKISGIIPKRAVRLWLRPDFLFRLLGPGKEHDDCLKILHDMSNSTIRARKKANQEKTTEDSVHQNGQTSGKKQRLAFLDLLLQYSEQNPDFSDEEVRKEVDTIMFAGHDTTTSGINMFLYNMGCYQDIQARLQEELDDIFCGTDRPATMEDLRNMKYTENCIKESLRLYPPVPFISRHLQEDVTICNYRIPAGTIVKNCIYIVHRDPEQFPNPEVFDPDRFLPENVAKRHPYAYVPFSAGPRNCIGQKFAMMEMKIVGSSILRKFKVESVKSPKDLEICGELILRPKGGNILKLTPRTGHNGTFVQERGTQTL